MNLSKFYSSDRAIAIIRSGWQAIISGALNLLLVRFGIDIDETAVLLLTWPLVHAGYLAFAYWFTARFGRLLLLLTGPGAAPIYNEIPDDVLEQFLTEQTATQ